MIRMIQSTSADHAKSYFSQALQKADYYINDQELQGRFHGLLSDRLGLDKIATKDSFFALCVYFGETDHVIPWQTDHLNCWRTIAADAIGMVSKVMI